MQVSCQGNKKKDTQNDHALYDLFYNTKGVHYRPGNDEPQGLTMLLNKQAIFATSIIQAPTYENLREFDDEYGILPYPKWDSKFRIVR